METTKNKLTQKQSAFLKSFSDYLEIPLLYYGSIQRDDYIIGKSDIDILVFTDNEQSTITKMQHFLHVSKSDFKKFIWKIRHPDKVTTGYKIIYQNDFIKAEFAIYNDKFKKAITDEHNSKLYIPFYIIWMLILLKILFYELQIIPAQYYSYFKRVLFSYGLGYDGFDKFVIL